MSVEIALQVLKFSYNTWQKIPPTERKKMLQAVKEKDYKTATHLAAKWHTKLKNPCQKDLKCHKCGQRVRGTKGQPFKVKMEKVRKHRARCKG